MPDGQRYKIPFEKIKEIVDKRIEEMNPGYNPFFDLENEQFILAYTDCVIWHDIKDYAVKLPNDNPDMDSLWRSAEKTILEV